MQTMTASMFAGLVVAILGAIRGLVDPDQYPSVITLIDLAVKIGQMFAAGATPTTTTGAGAPHGAAAAAHAPGLAGVKITNLPEELDLDGLTAWAATGPRLRKVS